MTIQKDFVKKNPYVYLPGLAVTLNNLAILHKDCYNFESAEKEYAEALEIFRKLATANPKKYLSRFAETLSNFANFHRDIGEAKTTEKEYAEAYKIQSKLVNENKEIYRPHLAFTAINMSIFYSVYQPDKKKSMDFVKIAVKAALPYSKKYPDMQRVIIEAIHIIRKWRYDANAFLEKIIDESSF